MPRGFLRHRMSLLCLWAPANRKPAGTGAFAPVVRPERMVPIRSDKSPHQVKYLVGRFTQRLDPKRWDRTTGTGTKPLGLIANIARESPFGPGTKSLRRNGSN
jgi:hypothetical protein